MEINPLAVRDVYVFGGPVRTSAQGTIGPVAFASQTGADREIRCDLALVAVGAVSADAGYSTSNLGESIMMREMMDRSTRVAVLADSTKYGRRLFAQVAELGRADYLISEAAPPPELADALHDAGVEVLLPPGV